MKASLRAGAAATAALFASGCVDTYTIPPAQLQYLNGYDIHGEQSVAGSTFTEQPYRLISAQGEAVDYNSTKELRLLGSSGVPLAPPGPYELIFINADTFDAVPLNGSSVAVPLNSIKAVEVVAPSPQRTNDLVIGLSLLAGIILGAVGIVVAANGQQASMPAGSAERTPSTSSK